MSATGSVRSAGSTDHDQRHGTRPGRILYPAICLGGIAIGGVLAYVFRGLLRPLLDAPHACGLRSGCVDTSPIVAWIAMFGFDAAVVALAAWHIRTGRVPLLGEEKPSVSARGWSAWLILVFAAAMVARLAMPGAAQFRWDEANISWLALRGLFDGQLALTSDNTTIDLPRHPASVYFSAIPLALFASGPGGPEAVLVLAALMNAATALLCAWFVRRWTGSVRAALASALVFSLGMWPVLAGRRAWPNDLMPPFAVLFMDAILLLAIAKRGVGIVWASIWLVVLFHLHHVAILLAPLLAGAAWVGRGRIRLRHLCLAGLIATALSVPYLYWEFSTINFLRDVRHALSLAGRPASIDGESFRSLLNLAGPGGLDYWLGSAVSTLVPPAALAEMLTHAGELLFLLGGFFCAGLIARPGNHRQRLFGGFVLAWVLVPTALVVRHSVPVAQWYFYFLLPGVAVLAGLGAAVPEQLLAGTPSYVHKTVRLAGSTLLAAYLAGSTLMLVAVFLLADRRVPLAEFEPVGPLNDLGTKIHRLRLQQADDYPVLIGAQARDVDLIRLAIGARVPTLAFDDCEELLVPRADGTLLYVLVGDTPGSTIIERAEGSRLLALVPRAGGSPYRVFSLPASSVKSAAFGDDVRRIRPECRDRNGDLGIAA